MSGSVPFFGWLDTSEDERRRVLEVIAAFREPDTRDELGLGAIRDAFANRFFPGTSTIQTRARYFLFVPWTYLDLERRRTGSGEVDRRARRAEVALIDALAAGDDPAGVIGIDARTNLQRLPSNIYWQGLVAWGICQFPGSQAQYHRSLDVFYAAHANSAAGRDDDGEPVGGRVVRNWHAGLPPAQEGFPAHATMRLTPDEAAYLRERVMASAPGSLLAFLVDSGTLDEPTDFAWQLPQHDALPARLRVEVEHARCFSEVMHGAALLYNLLLARDVPSPKWVQEYEAQLHTWAGMMLDRAPAFRAWSRPAFWELATSGAGRIATATRHFVDAWIDLALGVPGAAALRNSPDAQRLIVERERLLKRSLARLGNRAALERFSGAAGSAQLDFRWRAAQRILRDLLAGQGRLDSPPALVLKRGRA
jgi:hypothetical protein